MSAAYRQSLTDREPLDVLSSPTWSTKASGPGTDYEFIANAMNAAASPVVKAWVTSVDAATMDDADSSPSPGSNGTTSRDQAAMRLRRDGYG